MKEESEGNMKGVLEYQDDPIVSSDVIGNSASSVFDEQAGMQLNSRFFKVVSWYDNEMGYSNRMLDLAHHIHSY